jgi:purine-nucleoside phosphorylase
MNQQEHDLTGILVQIRSRARVGIILGSGLGQVAEEVIADERISTLALPGFPAATVEGHAGELILGTLAGTKVAVLSGRIHGYEGYTPAEVALPSRLLHALGCTILITTNASGGLNPAFTPGDIMLIEDHISLPGLVGLGPLTGYRGPHPRFVNLTAAYDADLLALAASVAERHGIPVHRGVYVMVGGPHYETPAEVRLLRSLGGDAVGMSTVPEVIVARQLGMRVLGISVISNRAAGLPGAVLEHAEVIATVGRALPAIRQLIRGLVAGLNW